MEQAELDPIAHCKLQLVVVNVVVVLGVLTSLEETIADVGEEGVAVAEERVGRVHLGRASGVCGRSAGGGRP